LEAGQLVNPEYFARKGAANTSNERAIPEFPQHAVLLDSSLIDENVSGFIYLEQAAREMQPIWLSY
jgi:hypothetical protein